MGHLDVVGVQKEKWTVDPFAALRKDGFVYGRGTIDDKDKVTSALMVMLLLKRMNVALDRDVIFLGEAGEEGASNVGIGFMVKEHWPEIEAEYAITEGGTTGSRDGKVRYVQIGTTEKVPRGVKLVSTGTSGHASRPRTDNPVLHLAQAVSNVASQQPPMRLNDTTRAYFERLATISSPEEADRYNHLTDPKRAPAIEAWLAEHEPTHYSMLRTSIAPTILKAGFRSNVVPSEGEATLDIRALPDENMPRVLRVSEEADSRSSGAGGAKRRRRRARTGQTFAIRHRAVSLIRSHDQDYVSGCDYPTYDGDRRDR